MDSGYSLSDIAAASGNEGFGGNSIWLIILFVLIFGMGGNGWNRSGDFSNFATAASQNELLLGQKFDALGQKVNQIGDGISSLGYSQLQQMNANTASINGNITSEGRALQTQLANCCCSIKEAVHGEGEATRAMIQQNKIETLQSQLNNVQNQLSLQNAMSGIPKINPYMYGIAPASPCACSNI